MAVKVTHAKKPSPGKERIVLVLSPLCQQAKRIRQVILTVQGVVGDQEEDIDHAGWTLLEFHAERIRQFTCFRSRPRMGAAQPAKARDLNVESSMGLICN